MTLSTEAITLIGESWIVVARHPLALTECFHDELFRNAPRLRPLFAGTDLDGQKIKLAAALGLVVRQEGELTSVLPTLHALSRRHAEYGVDDTDHDAVAAVPVHAIAARMGAEFSPAARDARVAAHTAVAGAMQAGAAAARRKTA